MVEFRWLRKISVTEHRPQFFGFITPPVSVKVLYILQQKIDGEWVTVPVVDEREKQNENKH